jgi:hypothetical protein
MKPLIAVGFAAMLACAAWPFDAQAQSRARTPPQVEVLTNPLDKCLRALDGSCTNPVLVDAARQRAIIVPSVRVSYFGTPAGTIGGDYIPFERFFRDNPVVFGLPVSTFICCNVIRRSQ